MVTQITPRLVVASTPITDAALVPILLAYLPDNAFGNGLRGRYESVKHQEDNRDELEALCDDVSDALGALAPAGHYFGWSPKDSAVLGFFPVAPVAPAVKTYRVTWVYDTDAETPEEAAADAYACYRDPSASPVFAVVEVREDGTTGVEVEIDSEMLDA